MQMNTEAILKLLPKRSWIILLAFTLLFAFIWLFPPQYLYFLKGLSNYLPLHMLMETFSIIVAAMIFAVGWEAYLKEKSGNIVIISTAFLAVVLIDFAHMLSFAGMPPFVTPADPEKAIFFWLCGRFFVAFAMLYIAVNAWRPLTSSLSRYLILAVSLMATGLIYWVGLWHLDMIPHTFIPGHGLTPLKIYLEWSVVAVLALTAVVMMARMLKKKQEYDAENILMAISLMILSEIFFMMYADVADLYNFMGHVYKVIAYYYLYRAIFAENIQKPYKELEGTTATISDLYNNAPCGYHSLDKNGVFIRINDTELAWLGYTREEVVGKMKFSDILTQRSLGIFKENFPQFKERGWVNNLEFELIRKDGTTFPVLASATVIKDSDGNYLMSRSTVYDISERQKAEEVLRESEEEYRTLIQKIQVAVVVHGSDTQILTSNHMAQELLGLSEEQLLGRTAIDPAWHFFRSDRTIMPVEEYPVNQVVATGQALRNHVFGVHRPGKEDDVWVLVNADPVFNKKNEIEQVIVTFIDITERKNAESLLAKREYEFRTLSENSPDVIVRYDREGRRIYVNPEFERVNHISAQEVIGKTPAQLSTELAPMADVFTEKLMEAMDSGIITKVDLSWVKNEKQVAWFIRIVPEFDANGKVISALTIWSDISERKQMEQELQEKDMHSQSLLRLSKNLELAQTYGQVIDTAREEVKTVLGYQNIWVYLFTEDKKYAYSLAAGGSMSDIVMSEEGTGRLTITGDPMLEEIASAKDIVVVEDAQTDPRTDKKIVAQLKNHTLVNVPIIFFDRHMGSVGTGTFGDEGVRVPSKTEEEYLRALASHLAVTLDRIHLLDERQKAEKEIRKLNRIYRMLSDCNQALVRADDENKLIADVCRIITEEGGYRMVWVGYPQDDKEQAIKPVASAGFEEGYLSKMKFSWGDNEYGRGPSGTAIRTAKYAASLNYDADPNFAPWKEEARKRGYTSTVSFPLVTDSKPFGTLTIYGGVNDVFNEEEFTLLQELASDLAFGIMTIRTRIERERTQIMLNEAQRIAHLGSWHMDLATNEVFWSEELYKLYGFDPALPPPLYTESMKLFTPQSWEKLSTSIAKAVETGASYELELETTAQMAGGRKWMLARGELVRDTRGAPIEVRGVVMDITQRKWAEQEIRHANAYNRSLIEVSLDPLVTISPDGKITDVNAATEAVTGHTRDELIGTDFSDYFSEPEKAKAGYHQVFEAGFVKDYPLEIKDKEGNLTPVIYNASVYRDEEGKITGVFAAARDVTEQKKAESEIRKLNRIYKTLSACNESLVRAKDENELVSNICKIIVDEGGYRLVWVGYAQDDEEKTVKPVAYAGYEEGYLSNKKFSWGDNEYGRGPTGTAIRTGKLYMNPDFTKDANFAPWKEDALKRGYASNVAFPLTLNGKPMGALNIYGSAPEAFNDEEIMLLQELASDLAYGIATIRTRIGREHAQAMLNEAQRIAHVGNWELDLINNVLSWSDEIYHMFEVDQAKFGASYEAFLGAIHPNDRDAVNFAYTNSLETKLPYSIDHRLLFPDGRIKYVHEQCETYYDENGKPLRSVGTVQDVSEQKKAEQEILKLNRVYRTLSACNEALVHAQDEPSLLSDVCQIIVEKGGYRMAWVGYKQEDDQKTVRPTAQAGHEEGFLNAIRITWGDEELGRGPTGTAIRTGEISVNKDMLTNPVMLPWRDEAIKRGYASSVGLPLRDNGETFASLTLYAAEPDAFNDEEVKLLRELAADLAYGIVTLRTRIERQEAEEALEQSERYLRSIIETSPLPMGSVNKEGVVTLLNDSFIKTFGYTIEDIHHVDMWFAKAYPDKEYREKTVGEWSHSIDEFVRSGTPIPPLEVTITAKDGLSHIVDLYTTQIESETFVIFHDVTEKKHFEETIKHQNEELESKVKERTAQLESTNKELEAFTYSVSHDLRAPLRSIDGFSAVVMEDYGDKLGDDGKEYLQRVRNAAEKMGGLIDDLLSLSRLTRGELNRTEVNLSVLAANVVKTLQEADSGRIVEVNIAPDMTDEADPRLMEVVLTNLFNNAWKFTSKTNNAKIEFSYSEKEGKNIYCVRDNGAGFDMNYASKMFQPFQRLHTAEEFPGTGIGLATVYRIIKKHGGEIWAEGKVGEGAAFYFTLGE